MRHRRRRFTRLRAIWIRARRGSREGWRRMLRLEGSPRAIALGLAIGIVVAFSPTIGFQMIIAAFLASMVRANPAPAMMAVWITNPLTIPPIYTATYYLGRHFWPGRPVDIKLTLSRFVRELGRFEFYEVYSQFRELLELGVDVLAPMFIGGAIIGIALGAISYPIALIAVNRARRLLEAGRHRLAERRARAGHEHRP
ncbi:MAG: DUF2062 domain-containing protein [Phycisphaerales bacterium]|nr:DUF2062 domain-containing protein [Phycisphaerales bacterium]